jgi:hypothetical protein
MHRAFLALRSAAFLTGYLTLTVLWGSLGVLTG